MTITATDTLVSLSGSQLSWTEIGLDDSRFTVNIAESGDATIEIGFLEPLHFHKDREPDLWATLVDSDGTLTHDAEERIVAHLGDLVRQRISNSSFTIENLSGSTGDDEDVLGVSFYTEYTPGETFGQWWDRIGWPIIAQTINVTDPGTFDAPYLLTDLAR